MTMSDADEESPEGVAVITQMKQIEASFAQLFEEVQAEYEVRSAQVEAEYDQKREQLEEEYEEKKEKAYSDVVELETTLEEIGGSLYTAT